MLVNFGYSDKAAECVDVKEVWSTYFAVPEASVDQITVALGQNWGRLLWKWEITAEETTCFMETGKKRKWRVWDKLYPTTSLQHMNLFGGYFIYKPNLSLGQLLVGTQTET